MKWEFLTPAFIEFQKIFHNAMKELFVNKCLCEEVSSYFFVIKFQKESKHVYYFNANDILEVIPASSEQTLSKCIHNSIIEKIGNRKYILLKSDFFIFEEGKFKILWGFSSECINQNRGAFLFRCTCEALTEQFSSLLMQIEDINQYEMVTEIIWKWSILNQYFIQNCLQRAADRTCMFLQKLYTPLNLPIIVELSGEYYEKAECQSNMVFLFRDAVKNIKKTDFVYCLEHVKFEGIDINEIELVPKQIRLIRKLLQIAQQNLWLVLGEDVKHQTFKVLGICKESLFQNKDQQFTNIRIRFRNHMQWDLLGNDTYIFTYKNGQYKIEDKIQKPYLVAKIKEYFKEFDTEYDNAANSIINALQQEHGTMIILMETKDAQTEVLRLSKTQHGLFNLEPKKQTSEIKFLSNIDGSIIMDTSGKIHGIGMILDGVSITQGSLARGARYNSAVKYRDYLKKNNISAMIFIISEDKTVDIIYS